MRHEQQSLQGTRKRLAVFLDGTWNKPESNTNVWRLYLMLADRGEDGVPQKQYYDAGVGTHWFDRISGGWFGYGLSENIRVAYRWLMEHYNPGDEIFIFGFSRGAFTARSLAGVIARCGLLKPGAPVSFYQLFERYRKGDEVEGVALFRNDLEISGGGYPLSPRSNDCGKHDLLDVCLAGQGTPFGLRPKGDSAKPSGGQEREHRLGLEGVVG